jgi:hypothetical protein
MEFLKSLGGLGTEEEEGYRTGPPGYIGWRYSFFGIDSGTPYTFKNTGSGWPVRQSYSYSVPSPIDCSEIPVLLYIEKFGGWGGGGGTEKAFF